MEWSKQNVEFYLFRYFWRRKWPLFNLATKEDFLKEMTYQPVLENGQLGFDKCGWIGQGITEVWEQTKKNFGVWKAGRIIRVHKSKEIPSRRWTLLLQLLKKKESIVVELPARVNLAIVTFMRSDFKILSIRQNLFIDRIQKFTEICRPEGSYYLHAEPKGKNRFWSRVGYLSQSLK